MIDNNLYNKAYKFAVKIVKLYQLIVSEKKEFVLSRQILKCGTSIGANISEANGGISEADFSAKISIAYKECKETQYWLSLLKDTDYINENQYKELHTESDELGRILYSILKTTRIKNSKQ